MPHLTPTPGSTFGTGAAVPSVVGAENHTLYTTTLGEYEFPFNPRMNTVRKSRDVASAETYSGAQTVDWGFKDQEQGLIGSQWELYWEMIPSSFWTQLKNFYESQEEILWDPKERAHAPGSRYYVKIVKFDIESDHRIWSYNRMNVSMVLNIRRVA